MKHFMNYLHALIIALGVVLPLHAQSQINFNTCQLVVIVEEPNKKIEEKLKAPELQAYQQEVELYNSTIKKFINQYWTLSSKPLFVNKQEAETYVAKKTPDMLILKNTKYTFNYSDYSSYKLSQKLFQNKNQLVENYSKKQLPYRATSIVLQRADQPVEATSYASASMPNLIQSEADLMYAVKSVMLQLDYRKKGTSEVQLMKMYINNAPHLKNLTLLVNETDLDSTVTQDIKVHYKLPIEITNQENIEKAIFSGNQGKAVALVIPNPDGSFSFKVFDASTMELLAQSGSIPPSEYYPELNNKIKAKHLEEFTHYCD